MTGQDPQTGTTPSIGLILPFDSALDREYWQYLPDDVDLFVSRTPQTSGPLGVPLISAVSKPNSILSVAADMAVALDPDVVVYACTSGSFIRGVDTCMQLHTDMEARGCRRALPQLHQPADDRAASRPRGRTRQTGAHRQSGVDVGGPAARRDSRPGHRPGTLLPDAMTGRPTPPILLPRSISCPGSKGPQGRYLAPGGGPFESHGAAGSNSAAL